MKRCRRASRAHGPQAHLSGASDWLGQNSLMLPFDVVYIYIFLVESFSGQFLLETKVSGLVDPTLWEESH